MSDICAPGPQNPTRIIVSATALISAAVGIATADIAWFFLALIISAALLCTGYLLLKRWLGWKPLDLDHLSELIFLLPSY